MTPWQSLAVLTALAAAMLVSTCAGAWGLWTWNHDWVAGIMLAQAIPYVLAVKFSARAEAAWRGVWRRRALIVVIGTSLAARCLLIFPGPVSTDVYRYVWDGRVQSAGINPYRYRPADPAVAFLRDATIYPQINRADTALTAYPPAAQGIFRLVHAVGDSVTAMKATMVGFEFLGVTVLLSMLRRRGIHPTRILLYLWHPLPLFEFAGSGHIDAAAIGLMLLALWLAERRNPLWAGALLGAATAVKFFPAVMLPALYRRWDWRLPLAMLVVVAVSYGLFIDAGPQVLGFLPGYFQEEGLAAGNGFFLIEVLRSLWPLPHWATAGYLLAGLAALGWVGLLVCLRPVPDAVSTAGALTLLLMFTMILSPHLAWYFTWALPLLCFRTSWALIYVSLVSPLLYQNIWTLDSTVLHALLYVPFLLILMFEYFHGPKRPFTEIFSDGYLAP